MPTYERRTRVRAPLDDVWAFHSRVSGLEALTPSWLGLRVESVRGPDGSPDTGILESGSEITMSLGPPGFPARIRWRSVIIDRERTEDGALFRDEMVDGPFDRWVHTHAFSADGSETVVHDRVEYGLPGGLLGTIAGRIAWLGLAPMFRHRHRTTRRRLERAEPNAFSPFDR